VSEKGEASSIIKPVFHVWKGKYKGLIVIRITDRKLYICRELFRICDPFMKVMKTKEVKLREGGEGFGLFTKIQIVFIVFSPNHAAGA